jgi:hypothetical protein
MYYRKKPEQAEVWPPRFMKVTVDPTYYLLFL